MFGVAWWSTSTGWHVAQALQLYEFYCSCETDVIRWMWEHFNINFSYCFFSFSLPTLWALHGPNARALCWWIPPTLYKRKLGRDLQDDEQKWSTCMAVILLTWPVLASHFLKEAVFGNQHKYFCAHCAAQLELAGFGCCWSSVSSLSRDLIFSDYILFLCATCYA